jgi:hypothetical protein
MSANKERVEETVNKFDMKRREEKCCPRCIEDQEVGG